MSQYLNEIPKVAVKRPAEQLSSDSSFKKARVDSISKIEDSTSGRLLISYDLELTDGSFASEVFQLGAKCSLGNFSRNVLPQGEIDWGVTKFATNITVKRDNYGCRQLYDTKLKEFVPSFNAEDSYSEFLKWIEDQKSSGQYEEVVLIAQGNTDMLALVNNFARVGLMEDLFKVVDLFGDSLKYFQNTCKTWAKFNLPFVYGHLFPDRAAFKAHSAIEDATALHDILEKVNSEYSREVFLRDIERASVRSQLCAQIAKNKISKTIAKSEKKGQNNNYVIKFLAPVLENLPRSEGNSYSSDYKLSSRQTHSSSQGKANASDSKATSRQTDKHPVQLLNELNRSVPVNYLNFRSEGSHDFRIECVIDGKTFEGKGTNKKEAKRDCALKVLEEVHHITY